MIVEVTGKLEGFKTETKTSNKTGKDYTIFNFVIFDSRTTFERNGETKVTYRGCQLNTLDDEMIDRIKGYGEGTTVNARVSMEIETYKNKQYNKLRLIEIDKPDVLANSPESDFDGKDDLPF